LLNKLDWSVATVSKPTVLIANASDEENLESVIGSARVVIDCVGPFRYYGEPVVKACVETKTNYVDINGETEFVERMYLKYHTQAQQNNVTIVSCCGFDCIPSEMGNLFTKREFKKMGWTAATVEMFVGLNATKGLVINYATYESAIQSLAHVAELRKLRKQMKPVQLPYVGNKKLAVYKWPRYEPRVGRWVVPFMGADVGI
ncbi:hypothetical protein HK102_011395, partial [Quaeritorhiza haematococci]